MNFRLLSVTTVATARIPSGAILLSTLGTKSTALAGSIAIAGNQGPVVRLGPNSTDRVALDIYAGFSCPACQAYHADKFSRSTEAFGDPLVIREHIVSLGIDSSAKILHDVAAGEDTGSEITGTLMSQGLPRRPAAANREKAAKASGDFPSTGQHAHALEDRAAIQSLRGKQNSLDGPARSFPTVAVERAAAIGPTPATQSR